MQLPRLFSFIARKDQLSLGDLIMKARSLVIPALLLGFFFVLAASCAKYAPTEVGVAPGAPAPEAKALWSYITKDSPYTEWRMWPGKNALYNGTVPHGALLTTYVNGGRP